MICWLPFRLTGHLTALQVSFSAPKMVIHMRSSYHFFMIIVKDYGLISIPFLCPHCHFSIGNKRTFLCFPPQVLTIGSEPWKLWDSPNFLPCSQSSLFFSVQRSWKNICKITIFPFFVKYISSFFSCFT